MFGGWILIPITCLNFLLWAYMGHRDLSAQSGCRPLVSNKRGVFRGKNGAAVVWCEDDEDGGEAKEENLRAPVHPPRRQEKRPIPVCRERAQFKAKDLHNSFDFVRNEILDAYKENHLAHIRLPEYSTLINFHHESQPICHGYVNPYPTQKGGENCLAVVSSSNTPSSHNLLRYKFNKMPGWTPPLKKKGKTKEEIKEDKDLKAAWALEKKRPTGFFGAVAATKDRERQAEKMLPFLENLDAIEDTIAGVLAARGFHVRKRGLHGGPSEEDEEKGKSGIVVMTVNDGEMDMISNFICSCQKHGISTDNFLVFAGSKDILTSLESMGVMAVYHSNFAKVSSKASVQYLDKTFVDMMWYKAFSVWLLLRMGLHVLFQDVDLVWFREPFSYFAESLKSTKALVEEQGSGISYPDAFFSDDGARSARYAPFFANSGFYLLRSSARTQYFAWSLLSAFDTLHQSGSHQNVFTYRLTEALDLCGLSPKLLDINEFPTGVKYHRDRPFMIGIKEGYERPYNFHMCWTLNKANKVEYFKKVAMWYITEQCEDPEALRAPQGVVYQKLRSGQAFTRYCCSGQGA
jgi:hypothetical protein